MNEVCKLNDLLRFNDINKLEKMFSVHLNVGEKGESGEDGRNGAPGIQVSFICFA